MCTWQKAKYWVSVIKLASVYCNVYRPATVCYLGYFHVPSLFNLTEPAEVHVVIHVCGCGGYMAWLLCKIVPTLEVQSLVHTKVGFYHSQVHILACF